MGTNYYLHQPDEDPLHTGKGSSSGWCFSLHVMPEKGINDLQDWVDLWQAPGARIEDEYGLDVPPDKMLRNITERSRASDWRETEVWPPRSKARGHSTASTTASAGRTACCGARSAGTVCLTGRVLGTASWVIFLDNMPHLRTFNQPKVENAKSIPSTHATRNGRKGAAPRTG